MGLPRPPGSPITLPAMDGWHTVPAGHGNASVRQSGPGCQDQVVRTHPFAPDARKRPGKTPVRTALSPRYLIRMRSQIPSPPEPQVQAPLTSRRRSLHLAAVLRPHDRG
jgi:hypothetical protein